MKKLWFLLALLLPSIAGAQSLPNFPLNKVFNVVQTDAALRALSVTNLVAGTQIKDTGYYAAGDMPEAVYTYQTSACTLSAGAGDSGSQIPPNVGGGCWVLNPSTNIDVRWWGAVPYYVGADPNGNNAGRMNKAITYAGALGNALPSSLQAINFSGGGLTYGISGPVINGTFAGFIHFKDFGLVAVATTGFTGGCAQGLLENLSSSTDYFDNIILDSNFLPINGLYTVANGTNRYNNIYAQRWEGACSTTTSTVTTASGSLFVADTNTSGLTTGMISRGNSSLGIVDRSVIIQVTANVGFYVSKAATASATGTATFNGDPNGISCGFAGANCGGTYINVNAFEYAFGDAQASINADRYGAAFACFGSPAGSGLSGCNDVYIQTAVFGGGVTDIYDDYNAGGLRLIGVELNQSNFATTEPSAANIIMADNPGPIKATAVDFGGGNLQAFVVDNAGNAPVIQLAQSKFSTSANVTLSTNSTISVYLGMSLVDLSSVGEDTRLLQSPYPGILTYGPGTIKNGGFPNTDHFSGVTLNGLIGQESYTASTTLTQSDCGYAINANFNSAAGTITLPDTLSGVGPSVSCAYWIFTAGNYPVTLANASTGLINGAAGSSYVLAQDTLYQVQTSGMPGSSLEWALSPSTPGSVVPAAKTATTGNIIPKLNIIAGVVLRSGPTAAFTDTFDTASNILNVMPSNIIAANSGFRFRYINNSTVTATLAAGTGDTLSGTMTVAAGTWRDFEFYVTSAYPTPAVTVTDIGGGNIN